VSPKAIYSREVTVTKRDGTSITLRQPHLDPAQCIGCGSCEHECPVNDEAAVRVTAVGETRSRDRRLLMDGGVTGATRSLENKQR
jgi:ferredoxin